MDVYSISVLVIVVCLAFLSWSLYRGSAERYSRIKYLALLKADLNKPLYQRLVRKGAEANLQLMCRYHADLEFHDKKVPFTHKRQVMVWDPRIQWYRRSNRY